MLVQGSPEARRRCERVKKNKERKVRKRGKKK
jgi:hypothetical protein